MTRSVLYKLGKRLGIGSQGNGLMPFTILFPAALSNDTIGFQRNGQAQTSGDRGGIMIDRNNYNGSVVCSVALPSELSSNGVTVATGQSTLTIPAGQNQAFLQLNYTGTTNLPAGSYVVPVTLTADNGYQSVVNFLVEVTTP